MRLRWVYLQAFGTGDSASSQFELVGASAAGGAVRGVGGEPSKWLTLYGTRVLHWWDQAQ